MNWCLWYIGFLIILLVEEILRKVPTGIIFCNWFNYSFIWSSGHRVGLQLTHLQLALSIGVIQNIVIVLVMRKTLLVVKNTVVVSMYVLIDKLLVLHLIVNQAIVIQVWLSVRILKYIVLLNYSQIVKLTLAHSYILWMQSQSSAIYIHWILFLSNLDQVSSLDSLPNTRRRRWAICMEQVGVYSRSFQAL